MLKANISQIMSGKPARGINKYMLEEVYFSESCEIIDPKDYDKTGINNPQNAFFRDGRYYYDFPALWYNTLSNNKAIALRKIDLRAETLNIKFTITVKRYASGASGYPAASSVDIGVVVQPNMSTFSILQNIARQVNTAISRNGRKHFNTTPEKTVELEPFYNYETSTASLEMNRAYAVPEAGDTHYFSFKIHDLNEDAEKFFKKKNAELPVYVEVLNNRDGTNRYDFANVWNREFLFVHASFVNGTSFNYLGRSGEFYTKPSKMYRFGGSSQQFYFEVSYDGRTPVKDRIGVFCIDLAFIYHDKDYQAE